MKQRRISQSKGVFVGTGVSSSPTPDMVSCWHGLASTLLTPGCSGMAVGGGRTAPCRDPALSTDLPVTHPLLRTTLLPCPQAAAGSMPGSQLGKLRHEMAAASYDYAALCQGHHPDLPPFTPQLCHTTVSPDFLRDNLCSSPRSEAN